MSTDAKGRPVVPGTYETAWASLTLLLSLVLAELDLPWSLLAAPPAVAGIVLSILGARARRRAGMPRQALWSGIGVLFGTYLLLGALLQGLLYGPIDEYRRCSGVAGTAVAKQACVDDFTTRLGRLPATLLE